jgi:hypothetical protein
MTDGRPVFTPTGHETATTPVYATVEQLEQVKEYARQEGTRAFADAAGGAMQADAALAGAFLEVTDRLRADLLRRLHFVEGALALMIGSTFVLGVIVSIGR